MIDVHTESLVLPKDAARMVPGRSGRGVSRATFWRWMMQGRRGVTLESCLIGGVRYTSRQAVSRFVARLNGAPESHRDQRAHQHRAAQIVDRQLDAAGF